MNQEMKSQETKDRDTKKRQGFLLRLPLTMRERAMQTAHNEGTSLNHFISLAVAEKLARLEKEKTGQHQSATVLRLPYQEGSRLH